MNTLSFCGPRLLHFWRKAACRATVLMVCALMLGACGKSDPDPYGDGGESIWRFAPAAIILNVKASSDLNLYRKKSHTLAVCAYQLSNDKGFNEMLRSKSGMEQLVQCGRFDESVVHYEQIFFPPGESRNISLDRQEGTRLFVLVGGYYDSTTPGGNFYITRIPIVNSWLPLVGPKAGKLVLDVYLDKINMHATVGKDG